MEFNKIADYLDRYSVPASKNPNSKEIELFNLVYYSVAVEDIDFDTFHIADILKALVDIDNGVSFDGFEEEAVYMDNSHPFSYFRHFSNLKNHFENTRKVASKKRKFI